ncbi:SOS response-associated peptidase [Marinibaculum pumilum]|uniref:Abasic site processing protein n=1 Tax=Marinibaculum pumilum TaxID=1766165 RepID=A0ABV7L867_9PROT
MCGRYSLTTPPEAMRRLFGFEALPNLPPRYNVAPTQEAPVVLPAGEPDGDGLRPQRTLAQRTLAMARWGLLPPFAKSPADGARMINARAETVATKPAFRRAFAKRRCLVPADGFYEWQKLGDGPKAAKQPWRIGLKGGAPFAFAGLFETWQPPLPEDVDAEATAGAPILSFTIITTTANAAIEKIHPRMPVMLAEADHDLWLSGAAEPAALQALLRPFPAEAMGYYRVSTRVNAVRNDDAECIAPLTAGGTED